jgi:hypothetical protein
MCSTVHLQCKHGWCLPCVLVAKHLCNRAILQVAVDFVSAEGLAATLDQRMVLRRLQLSEADEEQVSQSAVDGCTHHTCHLFLCTCLCPSMLMTTLPRQPCHAWIQVHCTFPLVDLSHVHAKHTPKHLVVFVCRGLKMTTTLQRSYSRSLFC